MGSLGTFWDSRKLWNIIKYIYKRTPCLELVHYKENIIYIFTPIIWSTLKRYHRRKSEKHKCILKTPYIKYLQQHKVQTRYFYKTQRYQFWCLCRIFIVLMVTLNTATAMRKGRSNSTNMYQHSSQNEQETHTFLWGGPTLGKTNASLAISTSITPLKKRQKPTGHRFGMPAKG